MAHITPKAVFAIPFALGTVDPQARNSPRLAIRKGATVKRNEQYSQGPDHRGDLPPLTQRQMEMVVGVAIFSTGLSVRIGVGSDLDAEVMLSSGRAVTYRPRLAYADGTMTLAGAVDQIHDDDIEELVRLHETIIARLPVIARQVFRTEEGA
jgi:hypothetical protein